MLIGNKSINLSRVDRAEYDEEGYDSHFGFTIFVYFRDDFEQYHFKTKKEALLTIKKIDKELDRLNRKK